MDAKKLQTAASVEEQKTVAGKICKNYLHGFWKNVSIDDLEFKRISGGLSNFLYYVALPEDVTRISAVFDDTAQYDEQRLVASALNDEPRKVLLRIYGQVSGDRAVDAIVTESVIFTLLSERRLGPKLHGVFPGGRIEEYIPARHLLTSELSEPAISMKIAEKLAAIHSMDVPLNKEPTWMWKTMNKWLNSLKEGRLSEEAAKGKSEKVASIMARLRHLDFEREVDWLKKFLATVDSPVVFCHNDLQEGNILYLREEPVQQADEFEIEQMYQSERACARRLDAAEEGQQRRQSQNTYMEAVREYEEGTSDTVLSDSGEPRLVLIDFEFCSYNYRGFDLANHFQEWMYDYSREEEPYYDENVDNLPNLEQKEIFIKEYLKHYNMNTDEKGCVSIDAVNHLLNEVDAFALASHLFWTIWGTVNATESQITFGYWEYAVARLDMYFRLKQEMIKKDKFGIPQKRKIEEVDI